MTKVKSGDKVKVHYSGRLESGQQFDSSEGRDPLEFEVGSGQVIKGFDDGLLDMKVGDKKEIVIQPDDAYGQRREDFIFDVPVKEIPKDLNPKVGQELQVQQADGSPVNVSVVDLNEEFIRLDANHPLAGQVLIFNVELVEIVS